MTIAFTGGGSGGHFYPIIAIAEAINDIARDRHLVQPKLYYLAPSPFDEKALFENGLTYVHIPAGKMRRYSSILNFTDSFVTFFGTISALLTLIRLYPDVVVSKGGFGSVPTVIAAHILRIPIVIHESDAKPGRANLLGAKFAQKIAISFESAAAHFPQKVQGKIARTGNPIRKALKRTDVEGARQFLGLEENIPTILILGGSMGSMKINEAVLSALPELVAVANIIHQTGQDHFAAVESIAKVTLTNNPHASRYHPFNYLSELSLQRAATAANLIISRAGAGAIAEIGLWKKPAIIIPIPESVSHDQRTNAYAFARSGAAVVIEEENLTPHLLAGEAKRIISDPELGRRMGESASSFNDADAASVIGEQVLAIALSHEA